MRVSGISQAGVGPHEHNAPAVQCDPLIIRMGERPDYPAFCATVGPGPCEPPYPHNARVVDGLSNLPNVTHPAVPAVLGQGARMGVSHGVHYA